MQNAIPDGVELAHLVQQGKASPVELLQDAITRANDLNPHLNAIIHRSVSYTHLTLPTILLV